MADVTCPVCDGAIPPKGATGPRKSYCSVLCRRQAASERYRVAYARDRLKILSESRDRRASKRARTVKVCGHCSDEFVPVKSLAQVYCSSRCGGAATRDNSSKSCSELDCIRPVRARGLCSMHYKRFMRANGAAWESDSEWSDRRRSNYHKRRALKRKLPADDIRPLDVFERDGWVCGICAAPVDRDLQWPDEMSASLDHVVPLSRGGHHVLSNVQLAHLGCNIRKGDSLQADAMSA